MNSQFQRLAFGFFLGNASIFRAISPIDDPTQLNRNAVFETNVHKLDALKVRNFHIGYTPWGDMSWPMQKGMIARRYQSGGFESGYNFDSYHRYITENPIRKILEISNDRERQARLDDLSPAEKYSVLVGDYDANFSEAMWREGDVLWKKSGIASWMGICEGSAAASVRYPEPVKALSLKSPDGKYTINFNTLDIKGLASMAWSSYNVRVPVAGSRCDSSSPRKGADGAMLDEGCFDSNPASWHLAVFNLLVINKQPLIMDRAHDEEVWNSPVVRFDVSYSNPMGDRRANSMAEAMIARADFTKDRYAARRSPMTTHIVRVDMHAYVAVGHATARSGSDVADLLPKHYEYDLEIDSSGNIIGGEWYSDDRPDFLWTIRNDQRPLSQGDQMLGFNAKWTGDTVPSDWLNAAVTAGRNLQPLAPVIEHLIEMSSAEGRSIR